MAGRSALAALLVVLLASACTRTPRTDELAKIATLAPSIMLKADSSNEIQQADWPQALAKLQPERVYVRPEGLYIVLSSFFVEERGVFVPRSPGFVPSTGSDPSYTSTGPGIFAYRIKG